MKEDQMTMLSPDTETEIGLRKFVEQLSESAEVCLASPTERTATKCCEHSRYVSDTVEGLLYSQGAVDPQLLSEAIEAITKGVEAVDSVWQSPQTPPDAKAHVQKMTNAMLGRRDDLLILKRNGRMAFLQRA